MLMRSVVQYYGPEGERLEELRLCDALTGQPASEEQVKAELPNPEPEIIYLGVIQIPVGVYATGVNGRPGVIDVRPQDIRFSIPAENKKEAFEKFAAESEAVVNEIKRRHEEKQKEQNSGLIIPNAAQSESINNLKLVTE